MHIRGLGSDSITQGVVNGRRTTAFEARLASAESLPSTQLNSEGQAKLPGLGKLINSMSIMRTTQAIPCDNCKEATE